MWGRTHVVYITTGSEWWAYHRHSICKHLYTGDGHTCQVIVDYREMLYEALFEKVHGG